jgi:predicted  nucleic acid-binding Zn-ribbon protein
MLVSQVIDNVYDVLDSSDEKINLFIYKNRMYDATVKFNTYNNALIREEKRGMIKKHPKGTPERKIIDGYFTQRKKLTNKITTLNHESLGLFEKFKNDRKKLQKEAEKLDNKIKETTEKLKDLDTGIDGKLPKDKDGKAIWVAEFRLTDEEKKEYQDRIKELETKTQKDEKFFKEIQRSTKKVSPIQVMQADGELAGQAKQLKKLLGQQAVKDYLQGKKNPLEDKVLTAYMKGSYSEDKLKEFLRTDAKGGGEPKLSSRDKAKGKRIPLGDGESLKREAYRRIYNYLELLTEKIKKTTKSGNLKRKLKQLQDKMKEHNTKMFADLETSKKSRATTYTVPAYRTLFQSLKEMKEISDKRNTSDNKRMLYAKKVFEGDTGKKNVVINKYSMVLMRDLMNIAMGQKLEKPPKKQKDDSKEPSEESKLQDEIKELKEKIDKFKNKKDKNMEEMKEYFNLQDELPKKMKELREKVEGMKGKVSGARKDGGSVEGTPASLREQHKERKRGKPSPPKERKELSEYEEFRRNVEHGVSTVKRRVVEENPKFVERYLKENPDSREYIKRLKGELKKAEEPFGEKTGLNAFRFFDVDMIQGQYVIIEREVPLSNKDKNYAQIEKLANGIKDILGDEKIMSAIEETYSKLTGGVVFGQDKESADKRKEVSEALASLKPFISERRRIKKLLKPIPDFLVKEMIADEEKLSKGFLNFLTMLNKMQIVDVSNILVDNNKLISDKNKVKGIGGNPYYNIFNKHIAVPLTYKDTKGIKSLFDYDEKLSEELIQSTKDEYSENTNSFLRDYWNVIIAKIKKDTDKLGNIYDMGKKEGAYAEQGKAKFIEPMTEIQEEFLAIHNPSNKKKKAFDEFFLALDEKQDGKAFFREVEDLVKLIIKLQKEYRTKNPSYEPAKELGELDINKVAENYSKEALKALDKQLDDYGYVSGEELNLKMARKHFRYVFPIPISTDDGEEIIMGALKPIAKQKNVDTVAELIDMEIENDNILIEALKNSFLNYFKQNKGKIKQITETEKGKSEIEQASLEQLKDEFEDLIKTFKSRNNVVDMSKVKINMDGAKLKELLVKETIGEELAKILDNDLTGIYNSYVKNLTKVKERHKQNIKNAEKIRMSLIPKTPEQRAKIDEEIRQYLEGDKPKKQGDEEE